ncbi:MAG: methylase [Thiotrichales bacterium]|mgnify:CR=1 FL=1|nr:methylase [Thiotrichales bacterium]
MKPFAQSADNNKTVIAQTLGTVFSNQTHVLEIGSGTGQHAVHLGSRLSHLVWQTSELKENHAGILAWLDEARLPNVLSPLMLDVRDDVWPISNVDGVFTANTLHIMSWPTVERLFAGVGRVLVTQGLAAVYGPFNFGGRFTSDSNRVFDDWLRSRDPDSGVRNFEDLDALATHHGMVFDQDIEMPSNNRILVWKKS